MDELNQYIQSKIQRVAYEKARTRGLSQTGYATEDWTLAEEAVLAALKEA